MYLPFGLNTSSRGCLALGPAGWPSRGSSRYGLGCASPKVPLAEDDRLACVVRPGLSPREEPADGLAVWLGGFQVPRSSRAGCRPTLRPPFALLLPIAADTRALRAAILSAADSVFCTRLAGGARGGREPSGWRESSMAGRREQGRFWLGSLLACTTARCEHGQRRAEALGRTLQAMGSRGVLFAQMARRKRMPQAPVLVQGHSAAVHRQKLRLAGQFFCARQYSPIRQRPLDHRDTEPSRTEPTITSRENRRSHMPR